MLLSRLHDNGMNMAKQPGLDDRHRDEDGKTRTKNGNTRIGTLREIYGENFAAGRRRDMKLEVPVGGDGQPVAHRLSQEPEPLAGAGR